MVAPLDASGLQRLELGAEVAEDGGGAAQEENNGVELQFEKKEVWVSVCLSMRALCTSQSDATTRDSACMCESEWA